MKIKDLMIRNPVTCCETDTLERAAQLMWDHDIGAVPVVGADGVVLGMLTDRDICMAAYTQGRVLSDCSVSSTMSPEVEACAPETSIILAEERMRFRQVRRLPVVENGKLIGIVSLNDLAQAAANRPTAQASSVGQHEIATTLARICAPRQHVTFTSHGSA